MTSFEPGGEEGHAAAPVGPSPGARRSWSQRLIIVVACLCIATGLVIAGSIALYLHHSSSTGTALAQREQRVIAKVRASGTCTHSASSPPVTAPDGQLVDAVLQVPKLNLVAPVFEGEDNPQLDIGVGHVPASSWPGFTGTDVLSAHDVTWFSHIDHLSVGDSIAMVTPCHTFDYTVVSHSVVNAGSPIFQSTHGRLVLVTCYPLNALFITPQRYLVEATLTAITTQGTVKDPAQDFPSPPSVPAPAALAQQGLDLAHNPAPLGVLSLSGSPTPAWSQSSVPLQAEAIALQLYFAALRAATQDESAWWSAIGPGVPFADARALANAATPMTVVPIHPTLDVENDAMVGALVTSSVRLGHSSATYVITMTASVDNNMLVMTGFSVQPSA